MEPYDVVILGSGPAGGTAAIYAARANLRTALVSGPTPGGQITTTSHIENFPGFPDGIEGPKLGQLVEQQARKYGAEFLFDIIGEVDLGTRPFVLRGQAAEYPARTLVISTGSSPRHLAVPGEKDYANRGVSTCAVCDGRFYEGKVVAVVGGGDSAAEEALYLSNLAREVHLIHRRDTLRAGPTLEKRVLHCDNIHMQWDTVVAEIVGNDAGVTGMVLQDTRTRERRDLPVDGVFVAIGHVPNSILFENWLDLDEQGYVVVDRLTRTSVPGAFAAGDVADPNFRQAITAAGTGCAAAMQAVRFIEAED